LYANAAFGAIATRVAFPCQQTVPETMPITKKPIPRNNPGNGMKQKRPGGADVLGVSPQQINGNLHKEKVNFQRILEKI
jgi:hypothetical protein